MTTFNLVWTPKKYSDFVTAFSVEDGGKYCQSFDRQVDSHSYIHKTLGKA